MRKNYRFNENNIVTLSVADLEELIYKTTRKVEQELFGGLLAYFNRLFDENTMIIETLDYLKVVAQQPVEKKKRTTKKKVEEKDSEIKPVVDINTSLSKQLEKMSEEERNDLAKSIKSSIQLGQLKPVADLNNVSEYLNGKVND